MSTMNQTGAAFLDFLARDIESCRDKLSFFPSELAKTITALTANVECDPDAPIHSDALKALCVQQDELEDANAKGRTV